MMEESILNATKLTTDALNNEEFLSLYLAVALGKDPQSANGYEKASNLFMSDGVSMHTETREALEQIAFERISGGHA